MPLVPLRPLLEYAVKNGKAFGAFNVNMTAQADAVVEIHDIFRSACIIQGADLGNAFMGGNADFMNGTTEDKRIGAKRIADHVRKIAENVSIPVVLHLDHGKTFEGVKAAIDGGYTSVMIDGSHLEFDQNVELTREIVKLAHSVGVTVEGELGVLAGVEDDVFSEHSTYTNPMKVCEFFKKTGADCLAISYGTKHGAVKGDNVKLRKEIAIASMENLRHEGIFGALVSHGSSMVPKYIVDDISGLGGKINGAGGVPVEELLKVIPAGICKINVDTDLRLAVTRNVLELFEECPEYKTSGMISPVYDKILSNRSQFDPRFYLAPIMTPMITGAVVEDLSYQKLVNKIKKGVQEVVGTIAVNFNQVGSANAFEHKSLQDMIKFYSK